MPYPPVLTCCCLSTYISSYVYLLLWYLLCFLTTKQLDSHGNLTSLKIHHKYTLLFTFIYNLLILSKRDYTHKIINIAVIYKRCYVITTVK